MHLLAAQAGAISDGSEPVDLAQSPADLIFLSAADTELAALAEARATLGAEAPTLRLANLLHFGHPFTVDSYLEATATKSRLVIARILGGASYFSYGLEQFAARLGAAGIPFAALPGDDKPDAELRAASTIAPEAYDALWAYLVEGGPENAANALRYAAMLLDPGRPAPPPARPFLRAGIWIPGRGISDVAALLGEPAETTFLPVRQHRIAPDPLGSARSPLKRPTGAFAGRGSPPQAGAMRPPSGPARSSSPSSEAETGAVANWTPGAPIAAIVFYRALAQGGGLEPITALAEALAEQGLNPLPIFVASLKDEVSAATLAQIFAEAPPDIVLNTTGFAVSSPQAEAWEGERRPTPLDAPGRPVLQVVLAGGTEAAWREGTSGLSARDIAMGVALPEVDGRVLTRAIAFKDEARFDAATECPIATYRAVPDRARFVAQLAAGWTRLACTAPAERRVAILLANYPNRDGRLANGVGLDTPAGTVAILDALAEAGYAIEDPPKDGAALMERILAGPTNWLTDRAVRAGGERLPLAAYKAHFATLPEDLRTAMLDRWGAPEDDPFVENGAFALSLLRMGNAVVGVQPARGYNIDPKESYHSPDLIPPHNYLAFYLWLRETFGAHAVIHMGKHGNLEWLPGKALALSESCWPEAILGPLPHLYPFIVNDPGEGSQAKRRAQAVIIDHLTPPMTRAETYGPLRDLEVLVDEYYEAAGVDPARAKHLQGEILSLSAVARLDLDAGIGPEDGEEGQLAKLDAYLCDLKEAQIRDGLHVFGQAPEGRLATDLLVALARIPRGDGAGRGASLLRALARDLGLTGFDPLDCAMAETWTGPRPAALAEISGDPWRTNGDTVERLELLAAALVEGRAAGDWPETHAVLAEVEGRLRPALAASGPAEMAALLAGLDGRFVPPGPSGAPTRGRPDVLPTGRNFFSVDSRAVPTPTAWALGWKSACRLIERHMQEAGDYLRTAALTAWGTSNMRTGGDDIAQALALMGVKPEWDAMSRRVTGFEILPLSILDRPRVDVTLRISGFFRDAFPAQIDLVASAAKAVMELDEPADQNPAAARWRAERGEAGEAAAFRVFGAKPGAYGAGLQAMIDERLWSDRADLAEAFLTWGSYAYGQQEAGTPARAAFESRLGAAEAVIQNQDNREHDILDSDDYYQFEGGMAATVETLRGAAPAIYHNDHSRPERPLIRTLDEEIGRVVRSRAANPKWLAGIKRHGYKGAFEIAATVDYLFAFAATTGAVQNHHFDLVYQAYLEDTETRDFIAEANPAALSEIVARFREALERGLWQPRSNSIRAHLEALT
ncbi:MAG: cobaltochelatase subunit CobN [Pseudomonadota bacterium]